MRRYCLLPMIVLLVIAYVQAAFGQSLQDEVNSLNGGMKIVIKRLDDLDQSVTDLNGGTRTLVGKQDKLETEVEKLKAGSSTTAPAATSGGLTKEEVQKMIQDAIYHRAVELNGPAHTSLKTKDEMLAYLVLRSLDISSKEAGELAKEFGSAKCADQISEAVALLEDRMDRVVPAGAANPASEDEFVTKLRDVLGLEDDELPATVFARNKRVDDVETIVEEARKEAKKASGAVEAINDAEEALNKAKEALEKSDFASKNDLRIAISATKDQLVGRIADALKSATQMATLVGEEAREREGQLREAVVAGVVGDKDRALALLYKSCWDSDPGTADDVFRRAVGKDSQKKLDGAKIAAVSLGLIGEGE